MPPAGVIAAVATVAGTAFSIIQQQKASKAAERAAQAQQRIEQERARRDRRKAIRSAQLARASAVATSVGAGSFGGSGSRGGIGSIQSTLGAELGFSTQTTALSGIVTQENINASKASGLASIGGDIASFASNFADFSFLGIGGQQQAPNLTQPVG